MALFAGVQGCCGSSAGRGIWVLTFYCFPPSLGLVIDSITMGSLFEGWPQCTARQTARSSLARGCRTFWHGKLGWWLIADAGTRQHLRVPGAESPMLQRMGGAHVESGDAGRPVLQPSHPSDFSTPALMKFPFFVSLFSPTFNPPARCSRVPVPVAAF